MLHRRHSANYSSIRHAKLNQMKKLNNIISVGVDKMQTSIHLIPSLIIEICDFGLGKKHFVVWLLFLKYSVYLDISYK